MIDRTTETGFAESELRAMERFLTARTIPLTYVTAESAVVHGTGVFYRSRGELFLVTAAHVLRGINPALLGVPDRPAGNVEIWNLGDMAVHHPKEFEKFDVAVIELLNRNFIERVAMQWQFVDESEVQDDPHPNGQFVIAGYPTETVEDRGGTLMPAPMLQLFTKPFEGSTDSLVPEHDMLVRYARTATGVFGAPRATPNLKGISGAAVYSISSPKAMVWSPEQVLRLAGVQVSFKAGSFARVTKWSLVTHLITLIRQRRGVGHG